MTSGALLTDLYELTMACGYWKSGNGEREAVFHVSFRQEPFGSGFALAAGLGPAIDYLRSLRFTEDDLAYLQSLKGADGSPLFPASFLDALREFRLTCDVDAIPEGTVVFANEPLLRVRGPLLQAQLLETALLNAVNFSTLIATKAARIVYAAQGRSVLEFGLRRAQGPDGGLTASRAAYLGGCSGTSNVLAGRAFGIPVAGTHAHSWVMAFGDERTAFAAYTEAMPQNVLLLVDTYDSLEGVRHAIEIGRQLEARHAKLLGIRLDSGDLAWLSQEARRMLDAEGFTEARIVASNDLDEGLIASLVQQGARIDTFGVGTRLVTAYDQPALGGVYKLGAIRDPDGTWQHRIKVSDQRAKTSTPGVLGVRRFTSNGFARGDMLWDELDGSPVSTAIFDPFDSTRTRDLLVSVFRRGELVYEVPSLAASRSFAARELEAQHPSVRRLENPHEYPVGLETRLCERRTKMIAEARRER